MAGPKSMLTEIGFDYRLEREAISSSDRGGGHRGRTETARMVQLKVALN